MCPSEPQPPLPALVDTADFRTYAHHLASLNLHEKVMETMTRKDRYLTPEAFATFLTLLSPDPELAGEKYEELRRQLIKFFEWRCSFLADQLADETLNRVVRKIQEGEKVEKNILALCLGIARFVFKEYLRHPENRRVEVEELSEFAAPLGQQIEDDDQC